MVKIQAVTGEENNKDGWKLWAKLVGGVAILATVVGGGFYLTRQNLEKNDTYQYKLVQEYNPSLGKKDAKVTVISFDDLQCPACKQNESVLEEVRNNYKEEVHWVFKHNPLSDLHPLAIPAAEAAQAANEQGKFWEYMYRIYKNQDTISTKLFTSVAEELKLDMDKWNTDKGSRAVKEKVRNDIKDLENSEFPVSSITNEAKALKVRSGTPTNVILIDGKVTDWWSGSFTKAQWEDKLNTALGKPTANPVSGLPGDVTKNVSSLNNSTDPNANQVTVPQN
jgi:protein-disulfide isomerase